MKKRAKQQTAFMVVDLRQHRVFQTSAPHCREAAHQGDFSVSCRPGVSLAACRSPVSDERKAVMSRYNHDLLHHRRCDPSFMFTSDWPADVDQQRDHYIDKGSKGIGLQNDRTLDHHS